VANKDPNASVVKGLPPRITGRTIRQRKLMNSTAAPSVKRRAASRPNPLAKAKARPVR